MRQRDVQHRSCGLDPRAELARPVRPLVPARHSEDDHEALLIVDRVDDTEVADSQTPQATGDEGHGTRRSRLECEGEDRADRRLTSGSPRTKVD